MCSGCRFFRRYDLQHSLRTWRTGYCRLVLVYVSLFPLRLTDVDGEILQSSEPSCASALEPPLLVCLFSLCFQTILLGANLTFSPELVSVRLMILFDKCELLT
jgi:hypothetical protein